MSIAGKSFVLSGTLSSMKRSEAKTKLEDAGASVKGSVSKNIDIVVCAPGAGTKQAKAEELGLTIWDEDDLLNALNGGGDDGDCDLDINSLNVGGLKAELKKRGLKCTGKKAELQQRLRDAVDEPSPAPKKKAPKKRKKDAEPDVEPEAKVAKQTSSSLAGKSVCLTGTLTQLKRADATKQLKAAGAVVKSGVSKTIDILIAAPGAGSKLAMAEALGIEVWDEDAMMRALTGKEVPKTTQVELDGPPLDYLARRAMDRELTCDDVDSCVAAGADLNALLNGELTDFEHEEETILMVVIFEMQSAAELVKRLIHHGADPDLRSTYIDSDIGGRGPIHLDECTPEVHRALLDGGASLSVVDEQYGRTATHWLVENGFPYSDADLFDKHFELLLDYAVQRGELRSLLAIKCNSDDTISDLITYLASFRKADAAVQDHAKRLLQLLVDRVAEEDNTRAFKNSDGAGVLPDATPQDLINALQKFL